jgi:hypothetical protein
MDIEAPPTLDERRSLGLVIAALALLAIDVRWDGFDFVPDLAGEWLLVVAAFGFGGPPLVVRGLRTGAIVGFVGALANGLGLADAAPFVVGSWIVERASTSFDWLPSAVPLALGAVEGAAGVAFWVCLLALVRARALATGDGTLAARARALRIAVLGLAAIGLLGAAALVAASPTRRFELPRELVAPTVAVTLLLDAAKLSTLARARRAWPIEARLLVPLWRIGGFAALVALLWVLAPLAAPRPESVTRAWLHGPHAPHADEIVPLEWRARWLPPPFDMAARLRLLVGYADGKHAWGPAAKGRAEEGFRRHLRGLTVNRPDLRLGPSLAIYVMLSAPEERAAVVALWSRQAALHPGDAAVLENALRVAAYGPRAGRVEEIARHFDLLRALEPRKHDRTFSQALRHACGRGDPAAARAALGALEARLALREQASARVLAADRQIFADAAALAEAAQDPAAAALYARAAGPEARGGTR